MLKEYEVVLLKRTVPSVPLPRGTKGAIVFVSDSFPSVYEVEFVDESGNSLGVYTVEEKDLEVVGTL
jgi:hypothetical protein